MAVPVDPGLALLFGSEERVRILAIVANAEAPLTAYRVASVGGMKPPNVYRELKRLLKFQEVELARTPRNRVGWKVVDPDVGALLRRRMRIVWSEDIVRGAPARELRAEKAIERSSREPLDLSRFTPGRPPTASATRRRREKDEVLSNAGARRSVRSGRKGR